MIIRDLTEMHSQTREDGVVMTDLLELEIGEGAKIKIGHATFPPGVMVPPAAHTADEYSFFLQGTAKCDCDGKINVGKPGQFAKIAAGEVHSSFNDSDENLRVLWMLVEKP